MMRSVLVLACVATASAAGHGANTKCTTLKDIVLKDGLCDGVKVGTVKRCMPPMEDAAVTTMATQMGTLTGGGAEMFCSSMKSSASMTCPTVGGEAKDLCDAGKADFCKMYAESTSVDTCSKDTDCPEPMEDTSKKPCCSNYKSMTNTMCTKVDSAMYILFVSDPLILSLPKQAGCGTGGASRHRFLLRSVATILTLLDLNAGKIHEGGW